MTRTSTTVSTSLTRLAHVTAEFRLPYVGEILIAVDARYTVLF